MSVKQASGGAVPTRRQRIDRTVGRVAVVLAVLGSAAIVVAAVIVITSRDDGETDATVPTVELVPITIPPSTSPPETTTTSTTTTVPPETTTATLPPETTTTAAPETTPAPETTVAPTTNVADVPTIPAIPVYSGLGAHQVMADPLPSGLPFAQVEAAWNAAKRLADLFPPQDWATARKILTQQQNLTDADLAALFGPLERMSLFLVDAVPQDNGYLFTLGVLTNTPAASTTTIWCTHWYADTIGGAVIYDRVELNRYQPFDMTPEQLRNDTAEVGKLLAGCA